MLHVLETEVPKDFRKYAKIEDVSPLEYFDYANEHVPRPALDRAKAAGVRKVERISFKDTRLTKS